MVLNGAKSAAAAKAAIVSFGCVMITVFSEPCRQGAAQGVELCLGVLAPSLFPFLAATNLFVNSGACAATGRLLQRPSAALFGVSGAAAPVILLSLIGGYPAGACGVAALHRQGSISDGEAQRTALFAVGAGPGFLISYVGSSLCHSQTLGYILLAAQALSVIIMGTGLRIVFGKADNISAKENKPPPLPFSESLVLSVTDAARSVLVICAFVTAFSAAMGVAAGILPESVTTVLYAAADVSGGVTRLANGHSAEAIAFAAGFGGLCVHFQIFAALGSVKVNKLLFFLIRIIQGLITAALTHFGLLLFPVRTAVFSTRAAPVPASGGSGALSGAVVVAVCICFLISIKQYRR